MALGRAQLPNTPNINLGGYVAAPGPSITEQILGGLAKQLVGNVSANLLQGDNTNVAVESGLLDESQRRDGPFKVFRDPLSAEELANLQRSDLTRRQVESTIGLNEARTNQINNPPDPMASLRALLGENSESLVSTANSNEVTPIQQAEAQARLAAGSDPRRTELPTSSSVVDALDAVAADDRTFGSIPFGDKAQGFIKELANKQNVMDSAERVRDTVGDLRLATGDGQGMFKTLGQVFTRKDVGLGDLFSGRFRGGQSEEEVLEAAGLSPTELAALREFMANNPDTDLSTIEGDIGSQGTIFRIIQKQLGL